MLTSFTLPSDLLFTSILWKNIETIIPILYTLKQACLKESTQVNKGKALFQRPGCQLVRHWNNIYLIADHCLICKYFQPAGAHGFTSKSSFSGILWIIFVTPCVGTKIYGNEITVFFLTAEWLLITHSLASESTWISYCKSYKSNEHNEPDKQDISEMIYNIMLYNAI